jgi:hypothetical protein
MRNMLALFGAALLMVVGAGWYLGWYKVRSQPASVPGRTSVNIDINTNKIGQDIQQGESKLKGLLENKGGDHDKLMLPSASSSKPDKPLFQFHSGDNGDAAPAGGPLSNHPLIQLGAKK